MGAAHGPCAADCHLLDDEHLVKQFGLEEPAVLQGCSKYVLQEMADCQGPKDVSELEDEEPEPLPIDQEMQEAARAMTIGLPWSLADRAAILTRVATARTTSGDHTGALEAYDEALHATMSTGRLRTMDGVLLLLDTATTRAACGDIDGAYDCYNFLRRGKHRPTSGCYSFLPGQSESTPSLSSTAASRTQVMDLTCNAMEELTELLNFIGPSSWDPFMATAQDRSGHHSESFQNVQLLTRLGAFKAAVMEYDVALEAYNMCYHICEQSGLRDSFQRSLTDALVRVGQALTQRGSADRLDRALEAYELAGKLLDQVDEGPSMRRGQLFMRIGAAYDSGDRLEEALPAYLSACTIFQAHGQLENRDGALLYNAIGHARQASQDWQGALAAFSLAVEIDHRLHLGLWEGIESIGLLKNVGALRLETGDVLGANWAFKAAKGVAERHQTQYSAPDEHLQAIRTQKRLDLACASYVDGANDFPAP